MTAVSQDYTLENSGKVGS